MTKFYFSENDDCLIDDLELKEDLVVNIDAKGEGKIIPGEVKDDREEPEIKYFWVRTL